MLIDWHVRPLAISGGLMLIFALFTALVVLLAITLSRRHTQPQAASMPPAEPGGPATGAPGAQPDAYQATLPPPGTHAPPPPATAAQVEQIHQDLAEIRSRLAEIERILREVE